MIKEIKCFLLASVVLSFLQLETSAMSGEAHEEKDKTYTRNLPIENHFEESQITTSEKVNENEDHTTQPGVNKKRKGSSFSNDFSYQNKKNNHTQNTISTPLSKTSNSSTENYRKYCHAHVNGMEETCTIKALYITEKAKLSYIYTNNKDKSWEWPIINEKDPVYVSRTNTGGSTDNHLFVGFEVIYRENDETKSFFSHLYASSTRKMFDVKKVEENPSKELYFLADFYNIKNDDFLEYTLNNNTVICAPLNEEKIKKFDAALSDRGEKKIGCTPNRVTTPNTHAGYHSEGMALAELYCNTDIFNKLKNQVKVTSPSCIIEACFVKFYSKFDFCSECQNVLIHSRALLEEKFNNNNSATVPLFLVGLATKNCGNSYWNLGINDEKCNNQDVHNNYKENYSFDGTIQVNCDYSQPFLFINK